MSRILLLIFNSITLIAVLAINSMAGTGYLNGKSVGEVSQKYDTLFTPAGYAFSIWGLIYMMLIAFLIYQWVTYFRKTNQWVIDRTGIYFIVANLANIGWILLWLNEYIGLSVIVMFVLLGCLLKLVFRLDLEKKDEPVRIIFFVWWPIAVYLGWIIVASVTNVAAFLMSVGWSGFPLTAEMWTILMILIATVIYIFLTFNRNLRESAVVGVWALVAIAIEQNDVNIGITITAVVAAVVVFSVTMYHGYKNRDTAPFMKLKRGEF